MTQFFGSVVMDVNAEQRKCEAVAKGKIILPESSKPEQEESDPVEEETNQDGRSARIGSQEIEVELPVSWIR